jgi:hypothetical protein
MDSIGLVAHFSPQGDWAFETALKMATAQNVQLNVFHFAESPYEAPVGVAPVVSASKDIDEAVCARLDRELRERYDERLGDFVDVGFRVCDSGRHNLELRRCLKKKEYQILVIPYLEEGCSFGNMPIEEFAYRFGAPVMLVGPGHPEQRQVNGQGAMFLKTLDLSIWPLKTIAAPATLQTAPVI